MQKTHLNSGIKIIIFLDINTAIVEIHSLAHNSPEINRSKRVFVHQRQSMGKGRYNMYMYIEMTIDESKQDRKSLVNANN